MLNNSFYILCQFGNMFTNRLPSTVMILHVYLCTSYQAVATFERPSISLAEEVLHLDGYADNQIQSLSQVAGIDIIATTWEETAEDGTIDKFNITMDISGCAKSINRDTVAGVYVFINGSRTDYATVGEILDDLKLQIHDTDNHYTMTDLINRTKSFAQQIRDRSSSQEQEILCKTVPSSTSEDQPLHDELRKLLMRPVWGRTWNLFMGSSLAAGANGVLTAIYQQPYNPRPAVWDTFDLNFDNRNLTLLFQQILEGNSTALSQYTKVVNAEGKLWLDPLNAGILAGITTFVTVFAAGIFAWLGAPPGEADPTFSDLFPINLFLAMAGLLLRTFRYFGNGQDTISELASSSSYAVTSFTASPTISNTASLASSQPSQVPTWKAVSPPRRTDQKNCLDRVFLPVYQVTGVGMRSTRQPELRLPVTQSDVVKMDQLFQGAGVCTQGFGL